MTVAIRLSGRYDARNTNFFLDLKTATVPLSRTNEDTIIDTMRSRFTEARFWGRFGGTFSVSDCELIKLVG